ncbi:hypothetical protein [Caballeronia pedi]|uniref:hypothetical protein n=1 Tax=Caballeronia pedi TaxID=1777141 RepID=UPI00117821AA|nr:hypothetical protein [Caballeronia pedi]
MKFLKALSRFCNGFRAPDSKQREPTQTPAAHAFVTESGDVARFIFDKRDLFANGSPKPKLFQPMWDEETARFETSVCGLNNVSDSRLWELGSMIRAKEGKAAIGAAMLAMPQIASAGLACEPWPMPDYPEHGVILGWSVDEKDARLSAQQDLVSAIASARVKRKSQT